MNDSEQKALFQSSLLLQKLTTVGGTFLTLVFPSALRLLFIPLPFWNGTAAPPTSSFHPPQLRAARLPPLVLPLSPLRHPRLHLQSASSPVPTLSPTSLSQRHRVIAGKTGGVPTVAVHTFCCSDSQDCLHSPTAAFSTRKQGCNQRETTSILQTLPCGFPLKKKHNRFLFISLLLVHMQPISNADFIVPVEIDGTIHQVLLIHYGSNISSSVGLNKEIN